MRGIFVWRPIMIDNICAFNFISKYTAPLLALDLTPGKYIQIDLNIIR
jgi:hypothetical protein